MRITNPIAPYSAVIVDVHRAPDRIIVGKTARETVDHGKVLQVGTAELLTQNGHHVVGQRVEGAGAVLWRLRGRVVCIYTHSGHNVAQNTKQINCSRSDRSSILLQKLRDDRKQTKLKPGER